MNRSRQRGLQKWYVIPAWSCVCFAAAGSTVMPHTGSIAPPVTRTSLPQDAHGG
jgi:hypothetical protein